MKKTLVIAFFLLSNLIFAQDDDSYSVTAGFGIQTIAPADANDSWLGKCYDSKFHSLKIPQLKGTKKIIDGDDAAFAASAFAIETKLEYGIYDKEFDFGKDTAQRYFVINFYLMNKTAKMDFDSPLPENAEMAISEIIYGWGITMVVAGNEEDFTNPVLWELMERMNAKKDILPFLKDNKLTIKFIQGNGVDRYMYGETFIPNTETMFQSIKRKSKPVPLYVGYKYLKNIKTEKIPWKG